MGTVRVSEFRAFGNRLWQNFLRAKLFRLRLQHVLHVSMCVASIGRGDIVGYIGFLMVDGVRDSRWIVPSGER